MMPGQENCVVFLQEAMRTECLRRSKVDCLQHCTMNERRPEQRIDVHAVCCAARCLALLYDTALLSVAMSIVRYQPILRHGLESPK